MPAKTFICKICGETVSKPKSYAYKDGRACRAHEETIKEHNAREAKAVLDKRREEERAKRREEDRRLEREEKDALFKSIETRNAPCHCCRRKDGLWPQDAMLEHAADWHQFPHLFINRLCRAVKGEETEDDPAVQMALKLALRTVVPCDMPKRLPFRVSKDLYGLLTGKALGVKIPLMLCGACRKKHNIDASEEYKQQVKEAQERTEKMFMDIKTMAIIGAAMEPVLDRKVQERLESN